MKLKQFFNQNEAAYEGNLGFMELMKFYEVASTIQMQKMEKILKDNNWEAFKK